MRYSTIVILLVAAMSLCVGALFGGNRLVGQPMDLGVIDTMGDWVFGSAAHADESLDGQVLDHPATRDAVLAEYGPPTQVSEGGNQWWYGDLIVMFRDDKVVGWVPLHASALDAAPSADVQPDRSLSSAFGPPARGNYVTNRDTASWPKVRVSSGGNSRVFRSYNDTRVRVIDSYSPGSARLGVVRSPSSQQSWYTGGAMQSANSRSSTVGTPSTLQYKR